MLCYVARQRRTYSLLSRLSAKILTRPTKPTPSSSSTSDPAPLLQPTTSNNSATAPTPAVSMKTTTRPLFRGVGTKPGRGKQDMRNIGFDPSPWRYIKFDPIERHLTYDVVRRELESDHVETSSAEWLQKNLNIQEKFEVAKRYFIGRTFCSLS